MIPFRHFRSQIKLVMLVVAVRFCRPGTIII